MTVYKKFVVSRFPEADVYPASGYGHDFFRVLDDADQNNDKVKVLGQSDTEDGAWRSAARILGCKR